MNFTRFGSSKGFTLTEILIVVVVIAVMASLVIPRFTGQTDKAAAAEAIGIMGAIHRALLQFNDENGAYPANNLQNITDITNTLGIDSSPVRFGWEFSTSGGTVTGTRDGFGTLTLAEDGTWDGTNRYAPNGDLWPHLPQ
ncbi:MAG TPA: prepilin-type N-terminal cleavage/methylation domain-containing protein [Candidatus Omnitrophota bacterium]|nr:prepilin-type N-terminal cleavage/methylation domain-containing protein [Candidatus Omnitrophota bacterium]